MLSAASLLAVRPRFSTLMRQTVRRQRGTRASSAVKPGGHYLMKKPYLAASFLLACAIMLAACSASPTPTAVPTAAPTAVPATLAPTPAITAAPTVPVGGVDVAWAKVIQPTTDVVALVNKVPIKKDRYMAELKRQLKNVTDNYSLNWYEEDNISYLPSFQDEVLLVCINSELARQFAAAEGIVVDQAARQAELDKAKISVQEGGQYQSWEEFLVAYGSTEQGLLDDIDQYLIYQGLLKAHGGPTQADQVHALHILVDTEEKGKEVLAKLTSGGDFAALAKEYSTDTGSAEQGGDLGWFPRGAMVAEFEEVAFSLGAGQTSDLVKSTYGYHIIRVVEKGLHELSGDTLQQQQETALQGWFAAESEKATIEKLVTFAEPVVE
jgi:foldase protein PrsA